MKLNVSVLAISSIAFSLLGSLPLYAGVVPNAAVCPFEGRQSGGNCIVKGDVYPQGNGTCSFNDGQIRDLYGNTWCWVKE